MVDVLPTTTTTTTFIYEVMVGIGAMNAANKHAVGWGRAYREDPSALKKMEGPKCLHCGGEPHWIENVDDDYPDDDVQWIENDDD
jgi:hypothetical protein